MIKNPDQTFLNVIEYLNKLDNILVNKEKISHAINETNFKKLQDKEKEIIIDNLDLLGTGNIKALQKLTNLNEENLKENIKLIRSLDPKPGRKYNCEQDNIFHPDVIVTKDNSEWSVELNEGTLPKIKIKLY